MVDQDFNDVLLSALDAIQKNEDGKSKTTAAETAVEERARKRQQLIERWVLVIERWVLECQQTLEKSKERTSSD
jgi:hypothetical protein